MDKNFIVVKKIANNKQNLSMLNKKQSRRNNIFPDEFNLENYKERIIEEISNDKISKKGSENNKSSNCFEYQRLYKLYMQEEMNNKIIVFVNRIILGLPEKYSHLKNMFQLHTIFLEMIKSTLLNELEVVYLKILLDKFGWEKEGFSFEIHILILCFEVKILLNDDINCLLQHFIQYKSNIVNLIQSWRNSNPEYQKLSISPKEINRMFKTLSKPSNPYCKSNFIDFNFIVDYLLELGTPLLDNKNETANHAKIKENKSSEIKRINIPNSNILNDYSKEFTPSNNISSNLKFIPKIIPESLEINKITNSIESINNNNFSFILNNIDHNESLILRNDNENRLFNKNYMENPNNESRVGSFKNNNDFFHNIQNGCRYSQQPSLNDDIIDDKLSLSFFKNINNTTLKNYNIENNSTMKKQDESQNVTNINFECSAMSSFNRYKKNRNEEIKFNSQGQILDLYNEKL